METIYFAKVEDWGAWLKLNHDSSVGIWFLYYKKVTGRASVSYEDSVCEALCWGWIDSIIKKIDEECYVRKFTPRKPDSNWSDVNRKRIEKLVQQNRMQIPGLRMVKAAEARGEWQRKSAKIDPDSPPPVLVKLFAGSLNAEKNFWNLPASHRKRYIGWIMDAKREETRLKRSMKAIEKLENNERIGI